MSEMTIEVQRREELGKNANRRARAAGMIPAVVYGGGRDSAAVQVNRRSFLELFRGSHGVDQSKILLLKLADTGQERHAMIRDLQIDPISRQVVHIDFQRVLMDQRVRVAVPIEIKGTAYGVKTEGGVLDFVVREVHIECLPGDIPAHIDLDVTDLHVGHHIEAGQLQLPDGVTLLDEPERVIVALGHSRTEDTGAEGDRAEPEVIKKGKPEA
jgi:large subunit ribosomal protein L25